MWDPLGRKTQLYNMIDSSNIVHTSGEDKAASTAEYWKPIFQHKPSKPEVVLPFLANNSSGIDLSNIPPLV